MINDREINSLALHHKLIQPYEQRLLQPHSYDCTLGGYILRQTTDGEWYEEPVTEETFVFPHEFLLASTVEYFTIPQNYVGFVQGKSSVGRKGLQIENAGLIDAGFQGEITLEFYNMSRCAIRLKASMPICQVYFISVDSPHIKDYAKIGHYNGQRGPTRSKLA